MYSGFLFSESSSSQPYVTTWWKQLLAGATAGAVSRTSTAPLDRLKIYIQTTTTKTIVRGGPHVSMHQHFYNIIREEGLFGLYRGFTPNCMKVVPAVSISFVVYEEMKNILGLTSN
ncbi:calcium-binding mitochondrial carrier protein SCaMC-3-like [Rhincodon typus]|uniref:calcium-binding mitochondrial carrier protein SCaMC-3-like n=1 Tax=Rhincodon typus TaxID=259920 RepID=UPI00202FCC70|nr:calcium-binding mitochondrial carrier protein SCaMC-3-like [Rhincodon typus]